MEFQRIKTVENPEFYLEVAQQRSDRRLAEFRPSVKKGTAPLEKSKGLEMYWLQIYAEALRGVLNKVLYSFPAPENFSKFYEELLGLQLDIQKYYGSREELWHLSEKVRDLFRLTFRRMKHSETPQQVTRYKKEFLGRVKKIVFRMRPHLEYLRHARGIFRQLPVIKSMPTIVIAGFPNVGKSTLLGALTGSQPRTASWPFTTQQIMLGYREDVQVVDTPGLLDRLPSERNDIEKQAAVALDYLADILLFVYDPTETCGYTMEQQQRLYESIASTSQVDVIQVYNKKDLREEKQPSGDAISVSAKDKESTEELWAYLLGVLPKYENPDEDSDQPEPQEI